MRYNFLGVPIIPAIACWVAGANLGCPPGDGGTVPGWVGYPTHYPVMMRYRVPPDCMPTSVPVQHVPIAGKPGVDAITNRVNAARWALRCRAEPPEPGPPILFWR